VISPCNGARSTEKTMNDNTEPIEILLVEDNPGEARLAVEALKDSKVRNNLYHVEDGVEATAFLRREGKCAGMPPPDLVLLDLNLPRKDGREVLAEIKEDSELRLIPVVVLTTSEAERDLVRSYDLHANAYVVKPIDLDRFMEVVQAIEDFWFAIVKLPPKVKGDRGAATEDVHRSSHKGPPCGG
jgi:chemotaxis family two-component system response regulator Rcp1